MGENSSVPCSPRRRLYLACSMTTQAPHPATSGHQVCMCGWWCNINKYLEGLRRGTKSGLKSRLQLGVVTLVWNPSPLKLRQGATNLGHSELQSEFQGSMGNSLRLCFKGRQEGREQGGQV